MSEALTARSLILGVVVVLALGAGEPAYGGGGAVALNTCDSSCPDASAGIYVGCGNGTVTDNRTGLVWLANADCFGPLDWNEAMAVVAGLGDLPNSACAGMEADECDCGLSDHSTPGEWRLPSMAEWKAMKAWGGDADTCEPKILNDVGNACWSPECAGSTCSFYGVESSWYWASSSYVAQPTLAWPVDLAGGGMAPLAKSEYAYVWPVRGGQ